MSLRKGGSVSGPGRHFFDDQELQNVIRAMEGTLTRYRYGLPGEESFVFRFEQEARRIFGTRCLAVNSCTSALFTGLAALGIGPGDEVIVPGYTFIASIATIVYSGATPVLAEIDNTLNLDPRDVQAKISPNTKAIMPVHMLGAPADLDAIMEIAREHGLSVIEDVAQACGGSIRDRRLGTIGTLGAFSLNYFKVITSGDGGFLLTADEDIYRRAYAIHDHGFRPLRDGTVDDDTLFGLNFRMSDLVGALALAQIGKIDRILARTRQVKAELAERVGDLPDGIRARRLVDPNGDCALALVYIFDDAEKAKRVADLLGTTALISSGRHYYGNMRQLWGLGRGRDGPAPFRGSASVASGSYDVGTLPRTDDILARAIALSTGSSDFYAATGFGVNVRSTSEEIELVASQLRTAIDEVFS
jgi:dTDP-4-amino-4,6-dideoxygalactose transaminase